MSRTTENLHVRGVKLARVVAAIEGRLRAQKFERIPESRRALAEKTEPEIVRIGVRREGKWTTVADARGFSSLGSAADGDLDGWAKHLSKELDRSVLAIWTWDGESSVIATRWKRGKKLDRLELLQDARRGDDGRARAPAKVLWPWLPKKEREAILAGGIPLVERATGTGDPELDKLLEDFEDVEVEELDGGLDGEEDDEHVYVPLETSVNAIGAAIGMRNPLLNPWDEQDGDAQLLFRRKR